MSLGFWRPRNSPRAVPIDEDNPYPVQILSPLPPAYLNTPYSADLLWRVAMEGRLFTACDADQNDLVTGQTSFANTTPTFLLRVPAGVICVPLFLNLGQTGDVAGGPIDVIIEIDDVDRYASAGTKETTFSSRRRSLRTPQCSLYSGATASAGFGARIVGVTIGQDVSPAEGAVPGPFWKPEMPLLLEGPASLLVYTYAASTGPTWFWSAGWAELQPPLYE